MHSKWHFLVLNEIYFQIKIKTEKKKSLTIHSNVGHVYVSLIVIKKWEWKLWDSLDYDWWYLPKSGIRIKCVTHSKTCNHIFIFKYIKKCDQSHSHSLLCETHTIFFVCFTPFLLFLSFMQDSHQPRLLHSAFFSFSWSRIIHLVVFNYPSH